MTVYFSQLQKLVFSVPLVLLVLVLSVDFLVFMNIGDGDSLFFNSETFVEGNTGGRESAQIAKANVLNVIYVLVAIFGALKFPGLVAYLGRQPHLLVLFAYLLVGATYSEQPTKVVTNTILIIIPFIAAVVFASANREENGLSNLYLVFLFPMLFVHMGSLYILLQFHGGVSQVIFSDLRYGGLAGNPNTYGATSVMGIWAGASLLLSRRTRFSFKMIALVSILLFLVGLALSGSGASILVTIIILTMLVVLRFAIVVTSFWRSVLLLALLTLVPLVGIVFLSITTAEDFWGLLTLKLGKDSSLTGRTELWAVAYEAISARPWLGWSFDSHHSVLLNSSYHTDKGNYHSGYLDTLVAGGTALFALVLYFLCRYVLAFVRLFAQVPNCFPLIVPFVVIVLMNLSEYSLLRPGSVPWVLVTVVFVFMTYADFHATARKRRIRRKKRRSNNRRALQDIGAAKRSE